MKDPESELVLPMDEDDSAGDGVPHKKVRRKKSKEERSRERRVILWTLIVVLGTTIFFWWWPKIRDLSLGKPVFNKMSTPGAGRVVPEKKNYVEYKL